MAGGGGVVRPVFLRVCDAAPTCAVGEGGATVRVEQGHGQDVFARGGLALFGESTAAVLEESYAKFKDWAGLKGILFTASADADYMADFESMCVTSASTSWARTGVAARCRPRCLHLARRARKSALRPTFCCHINGSISTRSSKPPGTPRGSRFGRRRLALTWRFA